MPLIKSISGIRGTIGGLPGNNLTPLEIVRFTTAYAYLLKRDADGKIKVVVGRDSRVSGEMLRNLVIGTLLSQGIDVIDIDMATTPTVEMTVINQKAQGGIILTASHNPQGWNALKLLNGKGEFLSQAQGEEILKLVLKDDFEFSTEDRLGVCIFNHSAVNDHFKKIIKLSLVDKDLIAAKNFKIVVDGINSIGGKVVPRLLKLLGVKEENIIEINCETNGLFNHKPEPLAENLTEIMAKVKEKKVDLGIVVDPDVDRLAFIDENGEMFGEEYTLVSIADYILASYDSLNISRSNGGKFERAAVSNLSSSRALKDITEKHGGIYQAAAVGEVNVVEKMKNIQAIIGGEGNGGIIYPELHYGRDALVGIALFLTAFAKANKKLSEFKKQFPEYFMVKDKMELAPGFDLLGLLKKMKLIYKNEKITDIDGVKIDWADCWVHLRASNTEPIIRIYSEAQNTDLALAKVNEIKSKISAYITA